MIEQQNARSIDDIIAVNICRVGLHARRSTGCSVECLNVLKSRDVNNELDVRYLPSVSLSFNLIKWIITCTRVRFCRARPASCERRQTSAFSQRQIRARARILTAPLDIRRRARNKRVIFTATIVSVSGRVDFPREKRKSDQSKLLPQTRRLTILTARSARALSLSLSLSLSRQECLGRTVRRRSQLSCFYVIKQIRRLLVRPWN